MQTLLQVTPLFQEPLDIPTSWMPAIKAAVMLCIALVQLVNTRTLVQSYLNSGLRQWHQLKHGSRVTNPGMTTGEVIAIKLRTVNTLVVKVCCQSDFSALEYACVQALSSMLISILSKQSHFHMLENLKDCFHALQRLQLLLPLEMQ